MGHAIFGLGERGVLLRPHGSAGVDEHDVGGMVIDVHGDGESEARMQGDPSGGGGLSCPGSRPADATAPAFSSIRSTCVTAVRDRPVADISSERVCDPLRASASRIARPLSVRSRPCGPASGLDICSLGCLSGFHVPRQVSFRRDADTEPGATPASMPHRVALVDTWRRACMSRFTS